VIPTRSRRFYPLQRSIPWREKGPSSRAGVHPRRRTCRPTALAPPRAGVSPSGWTAGPTGRSSNLGGRHAPRRLDRRRPALIHPPRRHAIPAAGVGPAGWMRHLRVTADSRVDRLRPEGLAREALQQTAAGCIRGARAGDGAPAVRRNGLVPDRRPARRSFCG